MTGAARKRGPTARLCDAIDRALLKNDVAGLAAEVSNLSADELVLDHCDGALAVATLVVAGGFVQADDRVLWRDGLAHFAAVLWRDHRERMRLDRGEFREQGALDLDGGGAS